MVDKILSELNPNNIPTEEEIKNILKYFDMSKEEEGYNLYLKDLVDKHGEKWVERVLLSVITTMSIQK